MFFEQQFEEMKDNDYFRSAIWLIGINMIGMERSMKIK